MGQAEEIRLSASTSPHNVTVSPQKRQRGETLSDEVVKEELDFRLRLQSYKIDWHTKSKSISPWICARYGWICLEKDLLQCVSCKSYLPTYLPSLANFKEYNVRLKRIESGIISSHEQSCFWRSCPCSEQYCTPKVDDKAVVLQEMRNRCELLSRVSDDIRDTNVVGAEALNIKVEIDFLRQNFFPSLDEKLLLLAVTGWTDPNKFPPWSEVVTVTCHYCCREFGLLPFKLSIVTSDDTDCSETNDAASHGLSTHHKGKKDKVLNPAKQHYSWCPWLTKLCFPLPISSDKNDLDELQLYNDNLVEVLPEPRLFPRWQFALVLFVELTKPILKIEMEEQQELEEACRLLLNELATKVEKNLSSC
ncbi:unnamed protein product [Soboliphyme baturini]|uniref:C3HC-type domain-containing protein n=1 Tax=Soboliphyme baturini TaxID=241478 RepID=A0A183IBU0_9BILA|nr:unnamed protein product [Soboliphyme baturini]